MSYRIVIYTKIKGNSIYIPCIIVKKTIALHKPKNELHACTLQVSTKMGSHTHMANCYCKLQLETSQALVVAKTGNSIIWINLISKWVDTRHISVCHINPTKHKKWQDLIKSFSCHYLYLQNVSTLHQYPYLKLLKVS